MGNAAGPPHRPRPGQVHPHVHGERVMLSGCVPSICGSSPRAWGTLRRIQLPTGNVRFIPTCMGNARPPGRRCSDKPVHPHVHGERGLWCGLFDDAPGSSPRAWGTQPTAHCKNVCYRFIPTCMGNALWIIGTHTYYTVHPHVHGERSLDYWNTYILYGSSPRAWGTHRTRSRTRDKFRFIPTCMGNAIPSYTRYHPT